MKKRALVTGVTKNIGKSICTRFLHEDYEVIGTYCADMVSALEMGSKFCDSLRMYQVDFSSPSQTDEFIDNVKQYEFNVVVNNAGMINLDADGNVKHEFIHFDYDSFDKVMQCNFYAPLKICLGLKENIKQHGVIINIASTDGMQGTYASLSYSASKAALINLSASLANNYYPMHGVRVVSLALGWIQSDGDTGMGCAEGFPGGKAGKLSPFGRNGRPDEVAGIVFSLTKEDMHLIHGANIVVDGGYSNHDVILYEEAMHSPLYP